MKVLIVDDDKKRAERVKNFLLEHNSIFDIDVTYCTDDARVKLKTYKYDLLVLDVVLPKRNTLSDKPNYENGLILLEQVTRRKIFKKPSNIIGITAHLSDIKKFKTEFEKTCNTVIEITNASGQWKNILSTKLDYIIEDKISSNNESEKVVITVHGIRTFGEWQNRFKKMALESSVDLHFEQYSYSYFSIFSFFIPYFRNKEVERFHKALLNLEEKFPKSEFFIFSHSFGTYITTKAIREFLKKNTEVKLKKHVLSGSVLKSNFDWSPITKKSNVVIINDCGAHDYILWVSNALVPKVGMAGRIGFHGFKNKNFINRTFPFGHSDYFEGDDFMNNYWLPLLSDSEIKGSSYHNDNFIVNDVFEPFIKFLGYLKEPVYISLALFLTYSYFY